MKIWLYWLAVIYLKFLAKLQILKNRPLIIGITGSVGKTTTLQMVNAAIKESFKIKISEKANSEVGLPLNILGFSPRSYDLKDWIWIIPMALIKLLTNWERYEIYVAEMGIDSPNPPKNMDFLLSLIKPKIGIFLNVYPVHIEAFKNIDQIAEQKGKLIIQLPKNGWAILNNKDKRVKKFGKRTKAKVIWFNGEAEEAAMAVAKILKIKPEKAKRGINQHFRLPPGRGRIIPGIKKTILIDSSYNASREPMLRALDKLKTLGKGRKIAVLGDMRELGNQAQKEHEIVARKAIKVADEIVTIGPLMKQFFKPKLKKLHQFDNTFKALKFIKEKLIKGGETILIKGSQNTLFLEIITENLMKEPDKANELLCRRGKFWDNKRKALWLDLKK